MYTCILAHTGMDARIVVSEGAEGRERNGEVGKGGKGRAKSMQNVYRNLSVWLVIQDPTHAWPIARQPAGPAQGTH